MYDPAPALNKTHQNRILRAIASHQHLAQVLERKLVLNGDRIYTVGIRCPNNYMEGVSVS